MKAVKRKVTDMTVDELKNVIHEAISEDMEVWRDFEIMADSKLMAQHPAGGYGQGNREKRRLIAEMIRHKCNKVSLHRSRKY